MKKFKWWAYLVPIIAFAIAAIQFNNTRSGLSRWKGGGFGMYSEIKYTKSEVWVQTQDTFLLAADILPRYYHEQIRDVMRFPNQKNLAKLYQILWKNNPEQEYHIQVWHPSLNFDSMHYQKTMTHEYAYNN